MPINRRNLFNVLNSVPTFVDVRVQASRGGHAAALKLYNVDNVEAMEGFTKEVDAYQRLRDVQGRAVVKVRLSRPAAVWLTVEQHRPAATSPAAFHPILITDPLKFRDPATATAVNAILAWP